MISYFYFAYPYFSFVLPNMDIEGSVHLKCGGVANRFKQTVFVSFVVLPLSRYLILWMCPSHGLSDFFERKGSIFELCAMMCTFEIGDCNLVG